MNGQPVQVITMFIDDREVGARSDETILQVAKENDIYIPTLCFLEGLSSVGSCRICVVEVEGTNRLLPACVTLVSEGMRIRTSSARLSAYRHKILELLFSERNHICAVCVSNGHCELQQMAEKLGMNFVHYPYRHAQYKVDATHDRYVSDQNRCILCYRCVRVCGEIEGAHTLDIMSRGINTRIISDLNTDWGISETCTRCGKCVQVCPTGALSERGRSVAENAKRRAFLPYLTMMRKEDAE